MKVGGACAGEVGVKRICFYKKEKRVRERWEFMVGLVCFPILSSEGESSPVGMDLWGGEEVVWKEVVWSGSFAA